MNVLKAGAAQLIVLHHLAFYGPMTDHARLLMPALVEWLDQNGRIAVQVFLVVGGFLAARSLAPQCRPGMANPAATVWRRYLKLAPPFVAAMLLAIAASALARQWMDHDSISAPATIRQLGAHLLLLHDVLGMEALSAGAWYVAIDFQLYALTALLLWTCGRLQARLAPRLASWRYLPWLMPVAVTFGVCASLLHFNRDAGWDSWAPYFFGSYGLGMLAWWAGDPARRPRGAMVLLALMVVPALLALALDFRSRIAVALAVACLLALFGRTRRHAAGRGGALVDWLARISYAVFLVHFPVSLVVNAAFARFVPDAPLLQTAGVLLAWGASLAAGAAFHRWVELPLQRALASLSRPASVPAFAAKPARVRG